VFLGAGIALAGVLLKWNDFIYLGGFFNNSTNETKANT
jgi:hypothetical protein